MKRSFRLRSSCVGWAIGLVVLTGGPAPSLGQQRPDTPPTPRANDPAKANAQMAFRQAIQRAVNLANQEKKYAEAVKEVLGAQANARRAFGPASEEADEALHVLQQFYNLSGDVAAELRALRELRDLRRERLGPRDWRFKEVEARLALRERVTSFPTDQLATLRRQIKEADALQQQGRLDEADAIRKPVLQRWRKVMPGDSTTAAAFLTDLGLNEARRQEFAKARGFVEEALAVRTRLLGEQHPDVAETILILARIAEADGDFVRARSMFERALTIRLENSKVDKPRREEGQPGDPADPQFVDLLEQVGRLLLQIGDHQAAQVQFQRAVDIRRVFADRARGMSEMMGIAGIGVGDRRRIPGTGRYGMDPGGLGRMPAMGLGGLTGQDDRRESPTRRPPSMFGNGLEDMFGDDFPGLGGPGLGLGGGFGAGYPSIGGLGYPDRGLNSVPVAITRDPSHPWSVRERAWMMLRKERLAGRGVFDAKQDKESMQDPEFARAAMRDESWIAYALCLRSLAIAMTANGERERAQRMRLLATAIGLEASDPSEETRPTYASFLDDFVGLLEEYGELDLAESLAVWSILYRRASFGERHAEYATGLARLAGVLRARGDFTQAMLLFEKALAVRREALADDHPDLAEILLPAAELMHGLGDGVEARRMAGQALAISDAFLDRSLPFLPERQRLSMLALRARSVSVMLDVTAGDGGLDAETYANLVSWKGITVSAALAQRAAAAAAGTGEIGDLRKQLARARDELNRLYYAVVPTDKSQEHARRTRSQVELSAALEGRLAQAVGWKPVRVGPAEVQTALPNGSVLIDVYHYQGRGRGAVPAGGSPFVAGPVAKPGPAPESGNKEADGRYAAFIVRRGSPPVRVELGSSGPIDREIQEWLGAIDRREDHEPSGRRLAKAIWEPVAPLVRDASTVLVSPDGALNFLPWGALPAEQPGSYLLERHAFALVPSPRQLAQGAAGEIEKPSTKAQGLLAVGGVDYQRRNPTIAPTNPEPSSAATPALATRGAAVGTGPVVFPPLSGTLDEVKAVAEVYRKSRAEPVRLVTGSEATKDRLMAAMPGNRYLLLATHGYFAPPEIQSALNPGDDASRSSWDEMSRRDVVGYHPGLLSGLAWAGASNPTPDPTTGLIDRGAAIMTAEEVAALNLRGCDLAVLSACQTGLGLTAGGEGVLGLQRAFIQAGASTVVASLWKVDDAATCVLMEQFHANLWGRKLPKLEALRRAQIEILNNPGLIEKRRVELAKRGLGPKSAKLPEGGRVVPPLGPGTRSAPALWAAFVLSGDIQ